jgi:L-lysine exporter family protein LysE/ArgO
MTASLINGFLLGLSLILAIGAQNAFVLQQGIKREYVVWVCSICALSDALLMGLGIFGFSQIFQTFPWIKPLATLAGASFLLIYGISRLWAVFKPHALNTSTRTTQKKLKQIILITLAFTWLNPHVYVDTVLLVGTASLPYQQYALFFWLGCVLSSFVFFFSLGFGARFLQPWFTKEKSWKILDLIVAMIMFWLSFSLLQNIA